MKKTLTYSLALLFALSMTAISEEVGRYVLWSGTIVDSVTHEEEKLVLKIDTSTGKVWRLQKGAMKMKAEGLPKGSIEVIGWDLIDDDYTKKLTEVRQMIDSNKSVEPIR